MRRRVNMFGFDYRSGLWSIVYGVRMTGFGCWSVSYRYRVSEIEQYRAS